MVQVLPQLQKQPSFGSLVGQNLGAGFSQGIGKGMDYSQQMALEGQKAKKKHDMFQKLFGQNARGESSGKSQFEQNELSLTPQQETILALEDPTAFNAYKHLKESKMKDREDQSQKENLKGTFEEMVKTLKKGNLGYNVSKYVTKEGRRDRQYFKSLNAGLESIGKEMVSKGVLSAPRFAFLLSTLPGADKTDAANAGAIESWSKELGIELPEEIKEDLKSFYGEKSKSSVKKSEKISSGSVIMKDSSGKRYQIPIDKLDLAVSKGLVQE